MGLDRVAPNLLSPLRSQSWFTHNIKISNYIMNLYTISKLYIYYNL